MRCGIDDIFGTGSGLFTSGGSASAGSTSARAAAAPAGLDLPEDVSDGSDLENCQLLVIMRLATFSSKRALS